MSYRRTRTSAALLLCLLALPAPCLAWIEEIDGPISNDDFATEVAVDGAGDVIAGGFLQIAGFTTSQSDDGFIVVKLDGETGAELWRTVLDGTSTLFDFDRVLALAVDGNDDVIAAGMMSNAGLDFAVVKLDGTSGAVLWRQELLAPSGRAHDVEIGPGNHVFAAGALGDDFGVVKFDGATGAELWRYDDVEGSANALALDGAGDVIATGVVTDHVTMDDLAVVKIDGATGAELWQVIVDGSDSSDDLALAVAVDGSGDPVVSGHLDHTGVDQEFVAIKYDGATGGEIWRREIGGTWPGPSPKDDRASHVALDASGDVVVVGRLRNAATFDDFTVIKLDGGTGADVWRREIHGTSGALAIDEASFVAVDASGDVVATGFLSYADVGDLFTTIKLDGATGDEIWRQELDGTDDFDGEERGESIALDGSLDVVAVGQLDHDDRRRDFTVIKLDGATGAIGDIAGQSLSVKDPGDPASRRLSFTLKDAFIHAPRPGSPTAPTSEGATIRIVNPTTLEEASFSLPAADWKGLGNPPGSTGYKYSNTLGSGPCLGVTVRPHKLIKVSCSGRLGGIPFTLDEPAQGSLSVSLRLGHAGPQCAVFGGLVKQDEPGGFKAKKAPGAPACP